MENGVSEAETGNADRAMGTEINGPFDRWRNGDRSAFLHEELRRLAHPRFSRERINHGLQTHDLVGKRYLKLLGSRTIPWRDHAHFLNSAVRTMRRVLIEHAGSSIINKSYNYFRNRRRGVGSAIFASKKLKVQMTS